MFPDSGRTCPVCRHFTARWGRLLPEPVPSGRVHSLPDAEAPASGAPDRTEMGSMPCHPFRLLCLENGTTRFSEDERATALPRPRAPFGVCYSGPAPTLEGLKHLAASPGTGHHTGSSTASRIRIHRQFRDHVAQPGYYGRSYADTCSLPSEPQFPRGNEPRDFWGTKPEGPPYPLSGVLRGSAPSSRKFSRKHSHTTGCAFHS